jgi:bifunctional non-homologous end joining protein LigD
MRHPASMGRAKPKPKTRRKARARPASKRSPRRTSGQAERLREYARKRDFSVTPEPAPGPAARAEGAPTFLVHKHDASRLHYDLRLELDGALASWAIPKGPSFDPKVKRLAVQTEDHPLEYGAFEGRIPDGEYGGGDSLIWDRGTYETLPPGRASEQRKKGHLHIELHGEKLKGRWHLVRTRGVGGGKPSWLYWKSNDEAANPGYDVVAARPESVVSGRVLTRGPERAKVMRAMHPDPEKLLERVWPPMLATLVDAAPPDEADWVSELKYDGFRVLSAVSGGKVAMWSRNQLDLSERFPEIARALSRLVVGEAVLDGEAVVLDEAGVSRFQRLQQSGESVLYAFDLLWLDGKDLRDRPLEERRDLLASLLSNAPPPLRLAERIDGGPTEAAATAKAHDYEGIIAKRRGSVYEPRRSKSWLKLKVQNVQELAVIGYTPSKGPASTSGAIGALLLGVVEGGKLVFAGKVGTGFSNQQRAELYRTLAHDRVEAPQAADAPRLKAATWVEPRLVAQVRFTEWTADGKLRHPAFLGLRPDKTPMESVRERPAHPPTKGRSAKKKATRSPASSLSPSSSSGASPATNSPAVEVALTHPDKLMYPKEGLTKRDVADYFAAVSGPLLHALAGRPLALEHWPKGVHEPSWFRQNIGKEAKPWMTLAPTPAGTKGGGTKMVRHLVADRPETLRWLAQHGALTQHMWSSRVGHLGMPDWVVFDLDPAAGQGIEQTIEVAHALKRLLDELSLPGLPKTSGKRGLHVFVPLAPGHTHEDALAFAEHIGRAITSVLPQTTMERALKNRNGRLYFDAYQNGYGKTMVAPYSLRGLDGAPVSTPLKWSEVKPGLDPAAFNLRTVPARIEKVGDLWGDAMRAGVRLPRFS